ncbi:hypothetical protein KC19_VG299000 [Ceratodon purpureus]|uniref:Uncharacterized protein n=1 Tax=Ceratodon purpureus TaxID=3225 RepID=A0A8T0HWP1_CERPU|nr:hypothetical protein KC19_VG299000 [Ceratodon purpureus]
MEIAKREPKEYRPYFNNGEIEQITEVYKDWWYKMTCDVVSEVYYKRDISLAKREAVKALHDKARQPSAAAIEKAKLEGADRIRKLKMNDMKKHFRFCNPKYHPHLADELDIRMRLPPQKTGSMTVDNLDILV